MRMHASLCLAGALLAACGGVPRRSTGGDDGAANPGQGGASGGGGTGGVGASDAATDGAGGEVPRAKRCGGAGATVGFPPTDFRPPVVHCHWGPTINVMSTTMVADLDGDGKPEIVFPAFDGLVHAITSDCEDVWSAAIPDMVAVNDLAVADLDGDGTVEVVGSTDDGVVIYEGRTGKMIGEARDARVLRGGWESMAIANLDGEGGAEVYFGNAAFRWDGSKASVAWVAEWVPREVPGSGPGAAAADFDGDGVMEIAAWGNLVDGATGKTIVELPVQGFYAVVEIEASSAGPEIVVADNDWKKGALYVLAGGAAPEPGKILRGPYPVATGGGPPAIADFDGDGEPEIGVAGGTAYSVFDRECMTDPPADKCAAPGVLWSHASQDKSSFSTTSTVFDFNCDGKAEVVYRDECWLRVFEGATGNVLFAMPMTSNTALEGAVVADVDGSGHAKIVVGTNDLAICPGTPEADTGTAFSGSTRGVFIVKDPLDRWTSTRRVWNQNAYHITNIGEDGHVPAREDAWWTIENSYRANAALAGY